MTNSNVIVESVSKGDQDVNYNLIEAINGNKLKFDVRSHTVKSQGHAQVYVWHNIDKSWNLIHHIFPLEMKTKDTLCYGAESRSASDFQQDVTELRRIALAVLS